MSREDFRRSWPAWLRGTAFGFPIGALPAGGAEVPTFLSYATEKRLSKHPEEFGHGAIEGVAGPEAANNAAAAGVLVPLLTIGLPTSATAAVILVAFQSYGLQPGPELFSESGPLVWTLIASLYIGNVMLLVLNLPMARVWARLLTIPAYGIYAGVLVFATLGAYATGGTTVDLLILCVLGLIGLLMMQGGIPVAPAVVGLILGPIAEEQLRRALTLSEGDPSILVSSPITIVLWVSSALALLIPAVLPIVRRRRSTLAGTQRSLLHTTVCLAPERMRCEEGSPVRGLRPVARRDRRRHAGSGGGPRRDHARGAIRHQPHPRSRGVAQAPAGRPGRARGSRHAGAHA